MRASLRRGALAGLVAGVLTAVFGYVLAEPLLDLAVRQEAARAAARGDVSIETFSRSTQHLGFLGSAIVVGIAFGVLYGVVAALLRPATDPWRRALLLGGAGFFALSLVPFLRYPSNPPGVGDPGTIGTRSGLWEASLVIGLVGVIAAAQVARGLAERGTRASTRQLAVVGVLLATVALTFVLPGNPDPVAAAATLVWQFRMLTIASLALLWAALAAVFGLLSERAAASAPRELATV